jgi:branched-chain amino acid transport system ATP-binding protein
LLRVEDVSAGYGDRVVLRDLSLTVGDGELVAVLGPNGAGKTTLMKTLVGVVKPRQGRITLDDRRLDGRPPHTIARIGVALVPEHRRIFSTLSVRENLLLASRTRRDRAHVNEDLEFVFDLFPILKERSSARGTALSGGQQQMLALARAVMQRPTLVLMDEPSTGLSPIVVEQLPRMIAGVRDRTNAAVLLVEQDAGVALALADRGYVLRAGRIVHEGSAEELGHSAVLLEGYLGRDSTNARSDA